MHAYQGDLCNPSDPSPVALSAPSFFDFDIAAVGLGLHHFDDPALAAKRLVERLRPGGVLLIIDFLPHQADHVRGHGCELDKEHSQAMATVTHHGFSPETIRAIFDGAGAGIDFAMDECADTISGPRDGGSFKRKIFLARGAKT